VEVYLACMSRMPLVTYYAYVTVVSTTLAEASAQSHKSAKTNASNVFINHDL